MAGANDWGSEFRETIMAIKDELEAATMPFVIEAAGNYELVQAMARALLNGSIVKPSLWRQCTSNVSRRFGLHSDEVEQVVGLQMIGQLQTEHEWGSLVDGFYE